jgi:23S rRNA pseudouridine1911/1915/1917 synthase
MSLNAGYVYRGLVRARDAGARVLAYHAARFEHSSPAAWRRAIEAGAVRVNGRVADCEQPLCEGDRLEFHRPPWEEPESPLEFRVVHEDQDVLVVEKPAGLQVLPAGPFLEHTLLHLVRTSSAARAASAPVHRLGRGTSGLVLFGRNAAARAFLSAELRCFRMGKTYLALASGTALPISCRARQPIGPRAHGPLQVYCVDPGGRPALTRLRVLARDEELQHSLVAAQPVTGRPDQIRIHLAACGAPLVGDPLFGVGGLPKSDARPGDGGYRLHSARLAVRHPSSGKLLKLRSRPDWL